MHDYDVRVFIIVVESLDYPDLGKQRDSTDKLIESPGTVVQVLRDVAKTLVHLENPRDVAQRH